MFDGQEYDYVFDIDIEDGKPPLKLPYNLTESAWDAAKKFLEKNELPLSYYEQVANWITENTKGARIGQDSQPPPQARDPWGSDRRYRPGDAGGISSDSQRVLPQKSFQTILEGNVQNAVNKITESSTQLHESGKISKTANLTAQEIEDLNKLSARMTDSPKDPDPSRGQVATLVKVSTEWPTASRVPGVALLARLSVSPAFVSSTSSGKTTIVQVMSDAGLFEPRQVTPNNAVHALRLLVNLFSSDKGRAVIDGQFETIRTLTRPFASEPESAAQCRALATLHLNLAVLLTTNSATKSREARAEALLTEIGLMLECESPHAGDTNALFHSLCALGTLVNMGPKFKQTIKMGVSGTLHFVGAKPAALAPNIKNVIQEIRDELR